MMHVVPINFTHTLSYQAGFLINMPSKPLPAETDDGIVLCCKPNCKPNNDNCYTGGYQILYMEPQQVNQP